MKLPKISRWMIRHAPVGNSFLVTASSPTLMQACVSQYNRGRTARVKIIQRKLVVVDPITCEAARVWLITKTRG